VHQGELQEQLEGLLLRLEAEVEEVLLQLQEEEVELPRQEEGVEEVALE